MRIFICSLAFLLSACASTPDSGTTVIPVSKPCKIEMPEKPSLRYDPPYDSLFEAVRDLLGDRELQTAYENELEVALSACTK